MIGIYNISITMTGMSVLFFVISKTADSVMSFLFLFFFIKHICLLIAFLFVIFFWLFHPTLFPPWYWSSLQRMTNYRFRDYLAWPIVLLDLSNFCCFLGHFCTQALSHYTPCFYRIWGFVEIAPYLSFILFFLN